MAARSFFILISLSVLVAVIDGFEIRKKREMLTGTPTEEDCMKPPISKFGHECCRLPKERIWGDLRSSMNVCFRKMRQDGNKPPRQLMIDDGPMTPETSEVMTPTEGPSEAFPNTSPMPPADRPGRKKKLSERLKDLFASVYKEIKNTINSIWQSVVIITDHFRRLGNDSCFMECVFEDQGFLVDKILSKAALLSRMDITLGRNELWHNAAVAAVEACYQRQMEASSNATCQSGSEEVFKCVFKQLFFNCPSWTQSDYCTSFKEFYQKCPDGPPPVMIDNHSTSPAPPPSVEESTEPAPSEETTTKE